MSFFFSLFYFFKTINFINDHTYAAIHDRARAIAEVEAQGDISNDEDAELVYPDPDPAPGAGDADEDALLFASTFGNKFFHLSYTPAIDHDCSGPAPGNDDDSDDGMVHDNDMGSARSDDDAGSDAGSDGGAGNATAFGMDIDQPTNNVRIQSSYATALLTLLQIHISSPAPSTPSNNASARLRRRLALNTQASHIVSPVRCRRSGKVVNNNFTPRTLSLALAGKRNARRATTTENALPPDKHQFFMDILKNLATDDADGPMYEAFARVLDNIDLQKELVLFVSFFLSVNFFPLFTSHS